MAWSLFLVTAGVSQGLGRLEQSQQRDWARLAAAIRAVPSGSPQCATHRTKLLWWKASPLIEPFTCWPAWELSSVQSPVVSCLWAWLQASCVSGKEREPGKEPPQCSCGKPNAEVLLTSAGVSAHLSVPLQPHGNLQQLKFICIPAPGHVNSKDDPSLGGAQPFCSAGNSSSGAAFLSWGCVWL